MDSHIDTQTSRTYTVQSALTHARLCNELQDSRAVGILRSKFKKILTEVRNKIIRTYAVSVCILLYEQESFVCVSCCNKNINAI